MRKEKNISPVFVFCVLLLTFFFTGCANKGNWQTKYNKTMDTAHAKQESEKFAKAKAAYLDATDIAPTKAEPWVHLAKMEFAHDNYGAAITMAGEALERKPSDEEQQEEVQAILLASGLRATIQGVELLQDNYEFTGSNKDDAQKLFQKIQDVLGDDSPFAKTSEEESDKKAKPSAPAQAPPKAPAPQPPKQNNAQTNEQKNDTPSSDQDKSQESDGEEDANYSNPFEFLPKN